VKVKIATLLFITYLFGTTDACQLIKFPLLVSHYVKHKRENSRTTLGTFLKMHYVDPQPLDADYAEDMQLPFKTTPEILCKNIPSILSMSSAINFRVPIPSPGLQPLMNENIRATLMCHNIFHPPKAYTLHNLLLNQ
jgi:hypothetical protein